MNLDTLNLDTIRSTFALSATLNSTQILLLSVLLVLLSGLLSVVYYFTANSLSNRARLAAVFPLMSLTTMLIISIIQSSLALSLGLVGALSIVRFRSAIKDPEELAYIFLAIALGLGFGAGQPTLTILFYVIIMVVILGQAWLQRRFRGVFNERDSVHLELEYSQAQPLPAVSALLNKHCKMVKLNRLDDGQQPIMLFLIKPKSTEAIEQLRQEIKELDPKTRFSLLEYQPLL